MIGVILYFSIFAIVKLQSPILSFLFLFLYLGVLIHNSVPHLHIGEETDQVAIHHHHSGESQHHHDATDENSTDDQDSRMDITGIIMHGDLGINHFNNFDTPTSYLSIASVVVAILFLLSSLWNVFLLIKLPAPPDISPDKQLQFLCLSATSRRGPPSFS